MLLFLWVFGSFWLGRDVTVPVMLGGGDVAVQCLEGLLFGLFGICRLLGPGRGLLSFGFLLWQPKSKRV